MRLGVPFIAPRQLGAVESNPGRQILPSIDWCTGQSGADFFPILAQPTVEGLEPLAHQTLSGAHRTVRCPQPTVGACHASPADCAADRCRSGSRWRTGHVRCTPDSPVPPSDRWPGHVSRADSAADRWLGRPLAHRTVQCTPDNPVNFSRTPPTKSRERPFHQSQPGAPDTVRCTTGQSGAPRLNNSWLYTANSFSFCIFSDSST